MIIKCKWFLNDYDIQMRKIIKWNANVNANKYQMRINIKCEWFPNDYVIQMRMQCKCECYTNANDYYLIMIFKCEWLLFAVLM